MGIVRRFTGRIGGIGLAKGVLETMVLENVLVDFSGICFLWNNLF